MVHNKNNPSLEMEHIKLERLKVYGKILTVLISVGIGTFAVALINNSYQNRKLRQQGLIDQAKIDLQEKKGEAERQIAEMKYLGDFLNYALEEDAEKRLRFTEYFAALTISEGLRGKWLQYHNNLKQVYMKNQEVKDALAVAEATGDSVKIMALEKELASLSLKLNRLKESPPVLPEMRFPPPSFKWRNETFGTFEFEPDSTSRNSGRIKILGDWEKINIVRVYIPQLKGIDFFGSPSSGRMRFHKKAVPQLRELWRAWEAAGLLDKVITFGGSYAPRFIRGSRTTLSNAAFGISFNINMSWNSSGRSPAAKGEKGSVVELVPIANEYGFFWGGHFKARPEGMLFIVGNLLSERDLQELSEKYGLDQVQISQGVE